MEKNPSFQINANAAQEAKDSAQDAQMQALERKMHAKDAKDAEQDAKDANQEAQMQDILRKNQELEQVSAPLHLSLFLKLSCPKYIGNLRDCSPSLKLCTPKTLSRCS